VTSVLTAPSLVGVNEMKSNGNRRKERWSKTEEEGNFDRERKKTADLIWEDADAAKMGRSIGRRRRSKTSHKSGYSNKAPKRKKGELTKQKGGGKRWR